MSLTTTTLAAALGASDKFCLVTSATDVTAGDYMLIDQEFVRVGKSYLSGTTVPLSGRGLNGTVAAAHASGANVSHGVGSDFANAGPQSAVSYPVAGRPRTLTSYSASGAIAMPRPGTDAVAILNGTGTLAMTLAAPTKDMDSCLLWILGNGKSASTVTAAGGFGLASTGYTILTMQNAGVVGFTLMAANAAWVVVGAPPVTGTSTALSVAVS